MKKLLFLLTIFTYSYSFACTCIHSEFSEKDYHNANYVVKGKVIKVNVDEKKLQRIITFKVFDSFKGKVDKIIEIRTAFSSAACGVNVNNKDKWLLFINEKNGQKTISLCNKNTRYNRRPNQTRKEYKENCKLIKSYIKKIKSYSKWQTM